MSIYGDNIFVKEESLDFMIKSLEESSKIFLEFNINESVGDSIKNIIKTVIDRIHEFLKWIRTKVKDIWNNLIKKSSTVDLDKTVKNAKEEVKNNPDKDEELEKIYNEKYPIIWCNPDYFDSSELMYKNMKIEESSELPHIGVLIVESSDRREEFSRIYQYSAKEFSEKYKDFVDDIHKVKKKIPEIEKDIKRQESDLRSRIDAAVKSGKPYDDELINDVIGCINRGISNCTLVLNYMTKAYNYIIKTACDINIKILRVKNKK